MRQALVVGIDEYDNPRIQNLKCAKRDATEMRDVLSFNYSKKGKGEPNFDCELMISSTNPKEKVTRAKLKEKIQKLFESEETDIALLYFSGHGTLKSLGGYLVTQDAAVYEEGISFNDIMIYANNSSIKEIVIILDCCKSGDLGQVAATNKDVASLRKGVSILTSSSSLQNSFEVDGNGIFTKILLGALNGGSADLLGNVTVAHLYQLADSLLGPWDQRPQFKTNSSRLSVLRKAQPKIKRKVLVKIVDYFFGVDYFMRLDPSFDKELKPKNRANERIMKDLRELHRHGLITTIGEKHLYKAAKKSTGCELSAFGKEYYKLIKKNMI